MASVKIPEQKVILVGDFGVGKSSLFRRFMCDTFISSSDRRATLGKVEKFLSWISHEWNCDFRSRPLLKDVSSQQSWYQPSALRHRRYPARSHQLRNKIRFLIRCRNGANRIRHIELLQVCRSGDSRLFRWQRSVIPQLKPALGRHKWVKLAAP